MALAQSLVGQAALFMKHSVNEISSAAPAILFVVNFKRRKKK
jgi:hypothetical protein